ncbi:EF-hand calcium-binding domain-containing protein 3 [Artibeus jamaicensis]|uniref:EF-hand calcium-binding domain-containing protein 3 n=1 Tax=Artibeus jamaicensis TaxID=9417 RepID=UPI00235A555C|nr:EF-hand calcium-binding domain-containing protein 3 [Artibeus jamaicensis]
MAVGTEQAMWKAKEFKDLAPTHPVGSGSRAGSQSFADKNLPPLTPQQLSAFQDIFELFSSSRTGTVGMQSLRAALGAAGIQLSPWEMREALQQADLDGDGTVGFEDFLGVFTNSHCHPQHLGQVKDSQVWDTQGLQTLFLETLFKLMRQGFVPHKSVREVMSYYSKKQRALPLTPGCRGRSQGQGCTEHSHRGLNFYCQAARISGLSHAQLASLLHGLRKAGSCSPYSQIPKLAPSSEVRFPKSYTSRHPWPRTNQRQQRNPAPAGFSDQPVEDTRRWKLAPSPPTLVQKQPHSPSPACLQIPAMKNL